MSFYLRWWMKVIGDQGQLVLFLLGLDGLHVAGFKMGNHWVSPFVGEFLLKSELSGLSWCFSALLWSGTTAGLCPSFRLGSSLAAISFSFWSSSVSSFGFEVLS